MKFLLYIIIGAYGLFTVAYNLEVRALLLLAAWYLSDNEKAERAKCFFWPCIENSRRKGITRKTSPYKEWIRLLKRLC
jgi:hypothetical protein